ncbi:HD-GYP domain-containing protein [Deinococcus sp. UYEF24]
MGSIRTHVLPCKVSTPISRPGRRAEVERNESEPPCFRFVTHHECWDASGSTAGLAGEESPLAGRTVAVADVLDALTRERPFKQAWSLPAAITVQEPPVEGVGS